MSKLKKQLRAYCDENLSHNDQYEKIATKANLQSTKKESKFYMSKKLLLRIALPCFLGLALIITVVAVSLSRGVSEQPGDSNPAAVIQMDVNPSLSLVVDDNNVVLSVYGENDEDVVYEFVYEKDGERQSFTIDNLPDETEGWTFVSREEKNKSRKKVINDLEHFVLYSGNDDVTDMILEQPGFQFLMLSPDLTKANDDDISRVHELYDYCNEYEYPFYAVTSSSQKEIDAWIDNTGGEYPFLFMDKTTIRTIDRNNPFILILNDGVIHYKYPIKAVPDESKLDRPFEQIDNYAQQQSYNADVRVAILLAGLVVPILILYFAERVALYILRSLRRKLQEKAVGSSEEDK